MKLYELTEATVAMARAIDDAETPEQLPSAAALDELFSTYDAKVDGYCRIIRNLDAEAKAVEAEEDRLHARKKTLQGHVAFLKDRLLGSLVSTGREKMVVGPFKVAVRDTPDKVFVETDPSNLPEEFRREKTTVDADKTALLEAFKRGDELPFGVSVGKGKRLEIK